MALNLTHQIGTLCGPSFSDPLSAVDAPAASAAALWKPTNTLPNLRCKIRNGDADLGVAASPPASPCRSPALAGAKRELPVACRALVSDSAATDEWVEKNGEIHEAAKKMMVRAKGVPVFVMLPLDTVRPSGGGLNRKKAMTASLMALKSGGVEGIMVDVWWGMVEKERPAHYEWAGYDELMDLCHKIGLKVQAVMSFHQCGGNVGDSVTIPLPRWVLEEMDNDPDLAYTDQWGRRNYEYVSLGCDTLPVLKGRTPIQCYSDFMRAFRNQFKSLLGSTIIEIQVGMGPAGELRYPSYPELNGTWKFPGIGAFQCYDKYMLSSLKAAAVAAGKPEWGNGGPTDAGGYNNWPEDTPFFRHDGGWNGPYGEFFLSWYSQLLLEHGERIVSSATSIYKSAPVKVSVKVAGIHWHYGTRSHAPELTAGYYNTRYHDGYLPIAQMLARHGAIFNFTCVEMRDHEQPGEAACRPEGLVKQVAEVTREVGVELAGENALPRYDETAHEQIFQSAVKGGEARMAAFTYLRMGPDLFQPENWRKFVAFVKRMGESTRVEKCRELVERDTEQTAPLVQETVFAMSR